MLMVVKNKVAKGTSKKATVITGVAVATAVGLGGYGVGVSLSDSLRDTPENYTVTEQDLGVLEEKVSSLKVRRNEKSIPEYSRDSLPTDWKDLDGNGCNTREDILKKYTSEYTGRFDGCKIKSGKFYDYYNGKFLRYDKSVDTGGGIQIDHIVAIGNAWISGGYKWGKDEWISYINDEEVLIPTSSKTNREKSDKDITEWKPANNSYLCTYAEKQVEIKDKYKLTVTEKEKAELKSILNNDCVVEAGS